jgi:hypothetical protein
MDVAVRYYAVALALAASFGVVAQPAIDPMDPAPEGYQWIELASIAAGSAVEDYNDLVAPDLVIGDHLLLPTITTPGAYTVDLFTDGHIEYNDGEDGSRQLIYGWAWDTSVGDWHAESFDYVSNNIAPTGDAPVEVALLVDSAMTPILLSDYFSDGEGDTLTYSLTSGVSPTGVSLSLGIISGTPTVENEDGVTLVYTANDGYGGTGTQEIFLRPLVTLPASDCTSDETSQTECELAFANDFNNTISFAITPEYSETVALDAVISQSPLAGVEMAPFSTVDLVISLGACGGATFADGTFADGTFADGTFSGGTECEDILVEVPYVIGLSQTEADDALDLVGLIVGVVTQACSVEIEDEVLGQNPIAGLSAILGSAVALTTSSGVACEYDLTGIPIGWYSIANATADQDFVLLMRDEATNGGGDWAYWLPGVPQNSANLRLDMNVIRTEASSGGADWARWAPGTQPGNTANLQLNMQDALNADFQ